MDNPKITIELPSEEWERLHKYGACFLTFAANANVLVHCSDKALSIPIANVVRTERNADGQRDFLFEFVRAKA